mmetsp:Transcript_16286/g.18559  ORF Transcript_16286/g.18559 Transcript_16286/m.18559 type:complete len:478 (+) Transcript_16286:124-1557(+)
MVFRRRKDETPTTSVSTEGDDSDTRPCVLSSQSSSFKGLNMKFGIIVLIFVVLVASYSRVLMATLPPENTNNIKPSTPMLRPTASISSRTGEPEFAPVKSKEYTDTGPGANCENFDHGDTSPSTDPKIIDSLFNCNSEKGTCKWHFPARFFDKVCGIGKDFYEEIENIKKLHAARELWLNGPPIVIPRASITPKVNKGKFRKEPFPTHNISMTHVHKTGGTSLVNAFSSILGKGAKGKRHTVYQPGKSTSMMSMRAKRTSSSRNNNITSSVTRPMNPPKSPSSSSVRQANATSKFLDGAIKYTSEWGTADHTLFAVIRDPAERFISAIGQATGAFGSSSNGIGKTLLNECVHEDSDTKETLRCFVNLVKTNGTLIEVHFTPMVIEISFATMWKDIPVAVFPFTEVPLLMNELGANPNDKKKDGHAKGYRKSPLLTNMTFSDYDEDSLLTLCQIYKVDVLFMNQLGFETHCDKYHDVL